MGKIQEITYGCETCGGHGSVTAGKGGQIVVKPCGCGGTK